MVACLSAVVCLFAAQADRVSWERQRRTAQELLVLYRQPQAVPTAFEQRVYARSLRQCEAAAALRDAERALAVGPAGRVAADQTYLDNLPTARDEISIRDTLGDLHRLEMAGRTRGWLPAAASPAGRLDTAERVAERLRDIRSVCALTRYGRVDEDWAIEAADAFRVRALLAGADPAAGAERAVAVLRAYEQRMWRRVERGLENRAVAIRATVRRLAVEQFRCRSDRERAEVRAELRGQAALGLGILAEITTVVPGADWFSAACWPDAIADLAEAERDAADDPAANRRCLDWCRRAERAAATWAPDGSAFARDVRGRAELRRLAAERAAR